MYRMSYVSMSVCVYVLCLYVCLCVCPMSLCLSVCMSVYLCLSVSVLIACCEFIYRHGHRRRSITSVCQSPLGGLLFHVLITKLHTLNLSS